MEEQPVAALSPLTALLVLILAFLIDYLKDCGDRRQRDRDRRK